MASLVAQTVTESTCSVGNLGSIPRLGRSAGEENGYPSLYCCLQNPMDCIVHGLSKELDRTEQLSLLKPECTAMKTSTAKNKITKMF